MKRAFTSVICECVCVCGIKEGKTHTAAEQLRAGKHSQKMRWTTRERVSDKEKKKKT